MRIISGSAKGARLFSPKGEKTRPTSDFIKESMFNIINDDLRDIYFLDLFAGTGAVGIEALSRGAFHATFVDISNGCAVLIRRNLEKTNFLDKSQIFNMDFFSAIKKLENIQKYDIIFIDPPYFSKKDRNLVRDSLSAIVKYDILAEDGYIIAETSIAYSEPKIEGLRLFRTKLYSNTKLLFFDKDA